MPSKGYCSRKTGWGHSYFMPSKGYFIGAECGQGYFHTLFYDRQSSPAQASFRAAGLSGNEVANAVQIDRCVWNYQTNSGCPRRYDCTQIVVHHKPTKDSGGYDCNKLEFRKPIPAPAPPPPPGPAATLPCKMQKVNIGSNCKCDTPGNNVKTVKLPGYAVGCQLEKTTGSGDSFSIVTSPVQGEASYRITATREDAPSCWCDDLDVQCCIVSAEAMASAGLA